MRIIAPAFLLISMLAACGGKTPSVPHTHKPEAITAPDFGDADPVTSWGGKPPQSYPVHGIDVARYQTEIDWNTARAAGVNFVFVKATEGGDMLDPMFQSHWQGAGRAGLARGAYHFFYHCRPAAEQARFFIKNVPKAAGSMPPVLDMEWTPFSPTCTRRRNAETLRSEAAIFIDMLTRHYGQRPILYTSIDFFEDNQMWKVEGADFWLRAVARHPQDLYNGQHWTFWQYTSTGLIPGIKGQVDINVFEGSRSDWRAWRQSRAP